MRGATLALALVAALAAPALADEDSPEKAQARLLLSQGNALFEKGDLKAALVDFRAAYALYPSPKLLINAAAAERELGDVAGAATDLRHFLDDAGDDDGALIDRARSDLRTLERRVGRIGLAGWPARTTFEIDGRAARDPTYVKPGTHSVKVQSVAGVELTRDVDVGAGETVELPMPAGARLGTAAPVVATVPARARRSHRGEIIGGVVAGVVVIAAGAVALGFYLASPTPQPLKGQLGSLNFSDFH